MKVIDLYNHGKHTVKLLNRIGAIPASWTRKHEVYRDFMKYGVSKTANIQHIQTREAYRARDIMEQYIAITKEEKQKLIEELQIFIQLLSK